MREPKATPNITRKMSALLHELIEKRKNDVINYEEYLRQIVELARKVHNTRKRHRISSGNPGECRQASFYDHLNGDTVVANQIYAAVMSSKQDQFPGKQNQRAQNLACYSCCRKRMIRKPISYLH